MVEIDPTRMAAVGVTVGDLRNTLQSANLGLPVGDLLSGNKAVAVESGPFCGRPAKSGDLVVTARAGKLVFLRDVASMAVRDVAAFGRRTPASALCLARHGRQGWQAGRRISRCDRECHQKPAKTPSTSPTP